MASAYDIMSDMAAVVSFRLDDRTRRAIERLARARRTTQSEVIREAIGTLVAGTEKTSSPYEAWEPVLGVAVGGPAELSEHTGRRFAALLRQRKPR
jgi:predicted DNA-binding protein